MQPVVVRFVLDAEVAVNSVARVNAGQSQQFKSSRACSFLGQVMNAIIAHPIVAGLTAESTFEVGPGSVEVETCVVTLLHQLVSLRRISSRLVLKAVHFKRRVGVSRPS